MQPLGAHKLTHAQQSRSFVCTIIAGQTGAADGELIPLLAGRISAAREDVDGAIRCANPSSERRESQAGRRAIVSLGSLGARATTKSGSVRRRRSSIIFAEPLFAGRALREARNFFSCQNFLSLSPGPLSLVLSRCWPVT